MMTKQVLLEGEGALDAISYGVGYCCGYIKRHLLTGKDLPRVEVLIRALPQLDLMAMEHGYRLIEAEDAPNQLNRFVSFFKIKGEEEIQG